MRMVKVYCPLGKEAPLYAFMDALEPKLRSKLLWQILRLKYLAACELREPHFKHFALEKYEMLYELREKGRVLVRIVFAVRDGEVILLVPFLKRQPRDTMKALERSLRVMEELRRHPEYAVPIQIQRFQREEPA